MDEKTGQIGGKLDQKVDHVDRWKSGESAAPVHKSWPRLVEKLVRLVENWTKKLTRSTGGKVAKVPRL